MSEPDAWLELTIEKGVYRGQGIGRHRGQVVFVAGGLPGDRLRVRVVKRTAGYLTAEIEAVLEPSADRRASPCPYVPHCGGCVYQELAAPAQGELKRRILVETLERAGIAVPAEVPLHAASETAWRTRATFHLQSRAGQWRLGLYEPGSHRVVDLEHCRQLSPGLNASARALQAGLARRPDWARRVSHVELAEASDGSAQVACLECDLPESEAGALAGLADAAPALTGLAVVAGPFRQFRLLRGSPFVETRVLDVLLRAHVRAFFQGNRYLVETLARLVVDAVPPQAPVLDLYCGVGLFALPLARRGADVRAVELSPFASADARFNAARAGLTQVRVLTADVAAALRAGPLESHAYVVADPPRTGLGGAVVAAIAASRPAGVIYVSCDPATLARDLRGLLQAGYRLSALRVLDLFPATFHMEAVASLVL